MGKILRLSYPDKIIDHALWGEKTFSKEGFLVQYLNGEWHFSTKKPVVKNGKTVMEGTLAVGDVFLIDLDKRIAAYVIEEIKGKPILIDESVTEILIGRKEDCHIKISDRFISGHHIKLSLKNNIWYVKDLNSTNGSFLKDKRIDVAPIGKNEQLKIGPYIISADKGLTILNADENVTFNIPHKEVPSSAKFDAKPYPWFSPAPRLLPGFSELNISIETAPTIGNNPSMSIGGVVLNAQMMAISLGMQALKYALNKRKHTKEEQLRAEVYAKYLTKIEEDLQNHAKAQRNYENMLYPTLEESMRRVFAVSENLWEKHYGDEDFLSFRLGTGTAPAKAKVTVPHQHLKLREDELDRVPEQLAEKYAMVDNMPIAYNLVKNGSVAIIGSTNSSVNLARSIVAQLSALHSYNEVKIIPVFSHKEKAEWGWMRWLPHCMSDDKNYRYMISGVNDSDAVDQIERIIKKRIESANQWTFGQQSGKLPHLVFVVSAPELLNNSPIGSALLMNNPELNVSGIFIGKSMADFPHNINNVIRVEETVDNFKIVLDRNGVDKIYIDGKENKAPNDIYDKFARSMAPIRIIDANNQNTALPHMISLNDGLQISKLEDIELNEIWSNSVPEKTLSVPVGIKANGERFNFDIHQNGHGPHGMVAGGTGSGKSQMAQTWIASMALHFSPQDVNFILVDFKGDSLLQPFLNLPHLAGSISNLDKDVLRSFVALESEMERRQQILSDFGCSDILEYLKMRRIAKDVPTMPYLVLVVDEFAEFKLKFPDFTKSLDHLYRGGRSLGIFVILMTQSPGGIVTDQMRANAAFRWCLSVKSETDSRELLGMTDATTIRNPGRAYVKSGDTLELIQSFFAASSYSANKEDKEDVGYVYSVSLSGERIKFSEQKKEEGKVQTQLDAIVKYIDNYCRTNRIPKAKPIWQKELPSKIDLFSLDCQGEKWSKSIGFAGVINEETGPKCVIGKLDEPERQMQTDLVHDFWSDGHIAVYGMPTSGKTTFLQTIQISLFNKYTPSEVQVYSIDIGGFGLRTLGNFPHVGGVSGDDDIEGANKILSFILEELDRRKKLFLEEGVGSPYAYVEATGKEIPTVILFVDNMNLLDAPGLNLNQTVLRIGREGASFGIYLACSFVGTSGVSFQLAQNIKSVYSLKMIDKNEYSGIVGRPSNTIPDETIGRGLKKASPYPFLFQTAIAFESLSDNKRVLELRNLAKEMDENWQGERPGLLVEKVANPIPFGSIVGEPVILGKDKNEDAVSFKLEDNVSLLVSDGKGVAKEVLNCIVKQLKPLNCKVWLCSTRCEMYESSDNIVFVKTPKDLDEIIETLANILRSRQTEIKENPQKKFDEMVIILDGMREFYMGCEPSTISRLEVFIRLGKNLGITIIGADTDKNLSKCRSDGDILVATMRENSVLLSGGKVSDHKALDTYSWYERVPETLKENEAVFEKDDNPVFMIRMGDKE